MESKTIKSGVAIKMLQFIETQPGLSLPVNLSIPLLREDVEFSLSLLFMAGYIRVSNSKLFINAKGRKYAKKFKNRIPGQLK